MPTYEYIATVRVICEAVNEVKGADWCRAVLEDVAYEVMDIEEVK